MRITRKNTIDDNEIKIDQSKLSKTSKLVSKSSNLSDQQLNEVS